MSDKQYHFKVHMTTTKYPKSDFSFGTIAVDHEQAKKHAEETFPDCKVIGHPVRLAVVRQLDEVPS